MAFAFNRVSPLASLVFWAVSPSSNNSNNAMNVNNNGNVNNNNTNNSSGGVRTSVYLDTNINYISGDGTTDNPFVIQ